VASILVTLEAADAPATFFLTGSWVDAFPAEARAVGARHPVGNHTYSHPDLTALGPAAVRRELTRAARRIREVAGREPRPLFRFPYGARDGRTIELVNALGWGSIRWTVDTLGWQGAAAGQSEATVRARVLAALRPGAIVLMHVGAAPDGTTLDADALPALVRAIRARGYELVSLPAFVR
jgi:peptidoglycan/xylan/chitin deacetylase (PgdA/CDA1 family)